MWGDRRPPTASATVRLGRPRGIRRRTTKITGLPEHGRALPQGDVRDKDFMARGPYLEVRNHRRPHRALRTQPRQQRVALLPLRPAQKDRTVAPKLFRIEMRMRRRRRLKQQLSCCQSVRQRFGTCRNAHSIQRGNYSGGTHLRGPAHARDVAPKAARVSRPFGRSRFGWDARQWRRNTPDRAESTRAPRPRATAGPPAPPRSPG